MNREQRRAAGERGEGVKILGTWSLYFGGTVAIDGEDWTFVFGGHFLLATRRMELPDGMKRPAPAQLAVARSYLTRAVDEHFAEKGNTFHAIGESLTAEEHRSGHVGHGVLSVAGLSFLWAQVARALDFIEPGDAVRVGLLDEGGRRYLRLDAPHVRLALGACTMAPGAPGVALLNQAEMEQLERAHVDDGVLGDPNAPGGRA